MMRRAVLLALLLPPLAAGARAQGEAGGDRTYTLDAAIHAALINNAAVLTTDEDIKIARTRVNEARLLFLPQTGFQLNASKFRANRDFVLSPEFGNLLLTPSTKESFYAGRAFGYFPLYTGGRNVQTVRLAKAALRQAETAHQASRMEIRYKAKAAFHRLRAAERLVDAARARLEQARRVLKRAGSGWGALEARSAFQLLRSRSLGAERALEDARLEFLKILNLELDTPIALVGAYETPELPFALSEAVAWAMELRPELRESLYRTTIDNIGVDLALSRRHPEVLAGGSYEFSGTDFPLRDTNWNMTVAVNFPLSFHFYPEIGRRRALRRQGQLRRAELQDNVRLEVRRAYEDYVFWRGEITALDAAAAEARGIAERALDAGGAAEAAMRGLVAVLDLEERLIAARETTLRSRAKLERAIGRDIAKP